MSVTVIVALVAIGVLLLLVFLGVHIAVALGTVGFVGTAIIIGFEKGIAVAGQAAYYNVARFDYAVIPLFILMGMLATSVGVSTKCYDTLALWLGRMPGGLGVATTWACAAFGTLNGSALVTASVFAKIAGPEMIRYKYDPSLSYGLIASAGNIGQLIPPSVLIVIYGALSGDSIGRLLMAGIAPGVSLAVMFSLIIIGIGIFLPRLVPRIDLKATWREKIISLKNLIPIAIVALIIIGGIFLGIFSSAEAGAFGCLVFFIYALIKRIPIKKVLSAIIDTVVNAGMLFIIMACAGIFTRFMTLSGFATALTDLVTKSNLSTIGFLFGVLAIFIILGCFIDAVSCIALCVPIFLPVAQAMGIDTIQFAMVAIIAIHCGGQTPPVGLTVFCVKAVAPRDLDIMKIFKGAVPFLIGMILVGIIFILVPQLSTFIPNAMLN